MSSARSFGDDRAATRRWPAAMAAYLIAKARAAAACGWAVGEFWMMRGTSPTHGWILAGALLGSTAIAGSALADLRVNFVEGAPTDRFVIANAGPCPVGPATVTIDLARSAAGLYVDTTAQGAGVQVFQPLKVARGGEWVAAAPAVADGDQILTTKLTGLPPGAAVTLTLDIDDSLASGPRGQTQIAGSEIEGAAVMVSYDDVGVPGGAPFGADGVALIAAPGCVS